MFDFFRARPKKRRVKIGKGGVIFSNPSKIKRIIFGTGTGVLGLSLVYLIYLYYPLGKAVFFYGTRKTRIEEDRGQETTAVVYEKSENRVINYDDFYLEIPDIFAVSRVKANVSVLDKNEYLPVLADNVVAHAKGSAFPGEGEDKTVYLFAHSTSQNYSLVRKNAVFYLLSKLKPGNRIEIGFSGKKYIYEVYESKVVGKEETDYLKYKKTGEESLLLQTCWPLGTNWNRLIVFSRLIAII
jgi:LPXTG-site transpeptidase (sortase) family protein